MIAIITTIIVMMMMMIINNNDDDIIITIIIILIIIIIINQHIDCSPATVCNTEMRDTYLWTTIPIPIKKAQKRN